MNSKNITEGVQIVIDNARPIWSGITIALLIAAIIAQNPIYIVASICIILLTVVSYWVIDMQERADKDYKVKMEGYQSGEYQTVKKCPCDVWGCDNKNH